MVKDKRVKNTKVGVRWFPAALRERKRKGAVVQPLSAEHGDERSQLVSDRGEKFIRNRAFR